MSETFAHLSPDAWVAIGTGVLAFVTLLLVLITKQLFGVAKDQWVSFENAERRATQSDIEDRKSRQQELRAYVHVAPPAVTREDVHTAQLGPVPGPPIYSFVYANFGKTPAKNVRIRVASEAGEKVLPSGFSFPVTDASHEGTIGPDQKLTWTHSISSERMQEFRSRYGAAAFIPLFSIYVYGEIRYDDVFGQEHSTTFRFRHGAGGSLVGALGLAGEGNDAN